MKEKSIVFIGFMGAGKTTIGKMVAAKLNREFIDVDEEIEKEYKMPVSQIFKEFGEKAFRDREKSLITKLCKQRNMVISLGGGAFLREEIREGCLSSCIVIFLEVSFEQWKERVSSLIESRPVLQGKTLEEMEDLFNNRQKIYAKHHIKIVADNLAPDEIADLIISKLSNF